MNVLCLSYYDTSSCHFHTILTLLADENCFLLVIFLLLVQQVEPYATRVM